MNRNPHEGQLRFVREQAEDLEPLRACFLESALSAVEVEAAISGDLALNLKPAGCAFLAEFVPLHQI